MKNNRLSSGEWIERLVLAVLFIGIGSLIYFVFSPLRPLLGKNGDYLGRIGLIALLLAVVWLAGKHSRLEKYRHVLQGLLIMVVAVTFDRIFSIYLIVYLGITDTTAAGWAIQKLNECFVVVCTVIALTCSRQQPRINLYPKGKLNLGSPSV
jgi:hypothetical protein